MKSSNRILAAALAAAAYVLVSQCGGSGSGGGYTVGENIDISVTPATINYGAVAMGDSLFQTVTVKHSGDSGTLRVTQVFVDSESADEFVICEVGAGAPENCQPPPEITLEVGDQNQFDLWYVPRDNIAASGFLVVEHNAPNTETVRIPIDTLAQASQIYVTPITLDYGAVAEGDTRVLSATVVNGGTRPATVNAVVFSGATSPDFAFEQEISVPTEMLPGDRAEFSVRYSPIPNDGDGLADGGRVEVYYAEQGTEDQGLLEVVLNGYLTAPEITVLPGMVDFGWVDIGESYQRMLTIRNDGTEVLIIDNISVPDPPLANEYIGLGNLPDLPLSIEAGDLENPGGAATVVVTFDPADVFPLSTDPIGSVVIQCNDRDEAISAVPVYARIQAPVLVATPNDMIDFGVVPQNSARTKQLTLFNAGQADLVVDSLVIDDNTDLVEFSMIPNPGFAPSADPPTTGILVAGGSVVVEFEFVNLGDPFGEDWGNLHISSNDTTTPEMDISLHASRTGAPVCEARINPTMLDYGIVPHGATKMQVINIESFGSGHCTFHQAIIGGCSGIPIPGFPFGVSCSLASMNSDFFVTAQPIPTPEGLVSGTATPVNVTFIPPENVPLIPEFDAYYGYFQVSIIDPYSLPCTTDADCGTGRYCFPPFGCGFKVPDEPGGLTGLNPNLQARSGVSDISVLPDRLDFGLTTIGCHSQTLAVTVYNTGTAPLEMTEVFLENCGPEFELKNVPPLPIDVSATQPLVIEVVYIPQNLGIDQCTLVIKSSDQDTPTFTVPLEGEGTYDIHQVDIFEQISGQNVDILFVVDDSGSMCEEQDRLAANMDGFIQHAQQWGNSYQIGVVSVCVNAEQCDDPGFLKTEYGAAERWVWSDTWPHFVDNVIIGCSGNSDSQEAGLEAARKALTLPLIHTSDTACTSPADCQEPDTCMEWYDQDSGTNIKRCGGWNAGFMREDAALEVVFLSDEEDQSVPAPDFYVDFFKSIKGFANESLFHAHSIVGDANGGCGDPNGGGTSADAGDRYIYVSEATGGVVESICNDSFVDALGQIGNIAFGLKVQFFLTRPAEPSTIVVTVNGVTCAGGGTYFAYDQPSNSIIFQGQEGETDTCKLPAPGDEIVVEYDAICYTD